MLKINHALIGTNYKLNENYGIEAQKKINYLLSNVNILNTYCINKKHNLNHLINALKRFKNGCVTSIYSKSKINLYFNRYHANNGLQNMPSEIRKFIQGPAVLDVDIVNSCPSILLHITNTYNIKNNELKHYVENRNKIIDQYYNGNKDKCKNFIQFALFSNTININNQFEKKLFDEISRIKNQLSKMNEFNPIYLDCKRNKPTNALGSFLMNVYSIYESNIIYYAMQFYKNQTGSYVLVQHFDGFQCMPHDNFNVNQLNEYIKNKCNIKINFCIKSNDSEITMPETHPDDEKTFDKINTEFEKIHSKIVNKSIFLKQNGTDIIFLSKQQLKTSYEHILFIKNNKEYNFINKWMVNNPSQRCYNDMGTYPPPLKVPKNIFNLWVPFAMEQVTEYEPQPENLKSILNHIKILCNNEQNIFDYIIKWIGQMIQFPAVKTICPTFISAQGAGKGTLLKLFSKMLGHKKVYETTDPSRDVWGAFNGAMTDSFIVNLNELSKKETIESAGKIKALITDSTLSINNKNINQFIINSYHRFIITTNNLEPINTSKDDRRNLIIRSSDELCNNKTYFKKMHAMLDDENTVKTCYEYFKSIERLDQFNLLQIPITEYQTTLKQLALSPIEQFLKSFTEQNHNKETVELTGFELFGLFKSFLKENNISYEIDTQKLSVRITNLRINGISKGRHTMNGNTKIYNIPLLKEHFDIPCLIDDNNDDDKTDTDTETESESDTEFEKIEGV